MVISVTDLIHDLHGCVYRAVSMLFQDHFKDEIIPRDIWIQHNVYLGYAISLVPFMAILKTLGGELWISISKCRKSNHHSVKRNFMQQFAITHGHLWSVSLILSLVIICYGKSCEHVM